MGMTISLPQPAGAGAVAFILLGNIEIGGSVYIFKGTKIGKSIRHEFKIHLTQTRYLSSYGWLILICSSKSYKILNKQKKSTSVREPESIHMFSNIYVYPSAYPRVQKVS